jgi:hypothetical protein
MSLDRQRIAPKFDYEVHQAIKIIAEIDNLTMERYVEKVVAREVMARIHEASLIVKASDLLGMSGISRESPSGFGALASGVPDAKGSR